MPVTHPDQAKYDAMSHRPTTAVRTEMDPYELRKHFEATYFNVRHGLVATGLALPIVLPVVAYLLRDVPLQASMSAYYHAGAGVVRDLFVGALIAIAAFLALYKGFSKAENRGLNLAGLFAFAVAIFPMEWECAAGACKRFSIHAVAAVLFFLCIAYVCWFCTSETLKLLSDKKQEAKYKTSYRIIGLLMIASPLAAVIVSTVVQRPGEPSLLVFFIEAFAVWVFASFWWTKSLEIRKTNAERLALEGKAERVKVRNEKGKEVAAIRAV
jgi:hypothetical protein